MSSVVTPGDTAADVTAPGVTAAPVTAPVDPLLAPIPLPETRRVKSKHSKRQRKRRERRLELTAAIAIVALALVVFLIVSALVSGHGARPAKHGPAALPAKASIPPVLLAQRDANGKAVSLTVLVPAANDRGGSLVLIPPGTMTEVASADLQAIGATLATGGPAQLQTTVQNLLGTSLAETTALDDAGLTAMVTPAGPLTVVLPERVERVGTSGSVDVVFAAGPNKVAPGDVPRLLSLKGQGNDLSRLARHQAFWEAWLARMHDQPSAIPATPPGLHRAIVALVAGAVRTRVVPVTSLGTTQEDGELYKVDQAEMAQMVADTFPAARTATGARPTVQILNGTGAIGLSQRVQDRLGPGFEVKLTGNAASFSYAGTQVVFYDRAKQALAEQVQKQLGIGQLVFSRNPIDVVDVTIVVGKDFT